MRQSYTVSKVIKILQLDGTPRKLLRTLEAIASQTHCADALRANLAEQEGWIGAARSAKLRTLLHRVSCRNRSRYGLRMDSH
jgi:hypothetical protein